MRASVHVCVPASTIGIHVHVWVYISKYGYKKKPKQNKKRVAFGIPTIQAFNPGLGHLVIDMVIKIKKKPMKTNDFHHQKTDTEFSKQIFSKKTN